MKRRSNQKMHSEDRGSEALGIHPAESNGRHNAGRRKKRAGRANRRDQRLDGEGGGEHGKINHAKGV